MLTPKPAAEKPMLSYWRCPCEVPSDGSAVIFDEANRLKSQQFQSIITQGAYHREIGREATATPLQAAHFQTAYHRAIRKHRGDVTLEVSSHHKTSMKMA